ncbi:MAG: serine hydroxymethyltransferase, partial [Betaproteobacteria bacterium]|nr:serine hydroxymethyltransferase [Betaproteobacteria bacterium]
MLNKTTNPLTAFPDHGDISQCDPQLWSAVLKEAHRQEQHIELIASGCEFVDIVEQLCIDRLKELYGASFVNVQANSGSQANQAVFLALLQPGDTIMGMSLAEGGHLTHGMHLNMSGKWFNVVSYGLNAAEEIDYEAMERMAHEHKPKLIIAGASAYALKIDWQRFAQVAKSIGAYLMVDMAHY